MTDTRSWRFALLLAAVAVFAAGCDKKEEEGGSSTDSKASATAAAPAEAAGKHRGSVFQEPPVDVAKKWHKAVYKDADAGKATEYVKDDFKEKSKDLAKDEAPRKNRSFGEAKVDGDTAKVKVTEKNAKGDKTVMEYQLEKEDGKWKITKVAPAKD